ncbi:MAG: ImmA/IrrE family metallo-endopeptidase [Polyangia bacterium]
MVVSRNESIFDFGEEDGLRFVGRWHGEKCGNAVRRTRGELSVFLGGTPIWGGSDSNEGIDWAWIELLEWLSVSWQYLVVEESYPYPLNPRTPSALEVELERKGDDSDEGTFNQLSDAVDVFLETHDMAMATGGLTLPSLRILRQGHDCVVSSSFKTVVLRADTVFETLERIGEALADRLTGARDERSTLTLESWDSRGRTTKGKLIAAYVGWPEEELKPLLGENPELESRIEEFEPDEILAAARMAGPVLDAEEVAAWSRQISTIPKHPALNLDRLTENVSATLAGIAGRPAWEQGYRLARSTRPLLPEGSELDPIDIQKCVENLGVEVAELEQDAPLDLDAIAVWGPRHGPAILINRRGVHTSNKGGLRATVGHELCHLIVDRGRSLPLADVAGGRGPVFLERRANAFSAEILLPQEVIRRQHSRGELSTADEVLRLFKKYGVSKQLGALQVINTKISLERGVELKLKDWSR